MNIWFSKELIFVLLPNLSFGNKSNFSVFFWRLLKVLFWSILLPGDSIWVQTSVHTLSRCWAQFEQENRRKLKQEKRGERGDLVTCHWWAGFGSVCVLDEEITMHCVVVYFLGGLTTNMQEVSLFSCPKQINIYVFSSLTYLMFCLHF